MRNTALKSNARQSARTAELRVVETSRAVKENRRFRAKFTFLSIALVVLMAGTVYSNLVLSETKADINRANSELTELESRNAYLSYELESMVSLKNAEEYAVNTLGLVKLDSSRIEYVNLQDENVIEGGQDSRSFAQAVKEYFDSCIDWLAG
ncbi:MAG: hypothetical protein Q4B42_07945 [Oscillospiraceae bacterium]|nr:hypothetical protein [Oscillospiraceae bacterium]